MNKCSIYPEKTKSFKTKLPFKINFWATVNEKECSGLDDTDVTLQRGKENLKFNARKLFGTLTNLPDSIQKHFLVRLLIRQKLLK